MLSNGRVSMAQLSAAAPTPLTSAMSVSLSLCNPLDSTGVRCGRK